MHYWFLVFLGGSSGTIVMTAFSYALSRALSDNYREPELLNSLMNRSASKVNVSKNSWRGWLLHFAIGWLFAALYIVLTGVLPSFQSFAEVMIYGAISGLIAIATWAGLFALSHNPPANKRLVYFTQLFFAHLLFAAGFFVVFFLV